MNSLDIQNPGTRAIVAYLRDYQAMTIRQIVVCLAACVGAIAALILAFRWCQQRQSAKKNGLRGRLKLAVERAGFRA
jgi:hypothetical protein